MDDREPPTSAARRLAHRLLAVFGSFGLACILLILLGLLTFLGTLEQAHRSLYDVQRDYFESLFHVHPLPLGDLGSIPLPLPGAYLLLALLGANLVVGGMVRIRKSQSTVGVLVTHVGIAVLLLGSFVEFQWSRKGHMSISEGEASSEFESYYEWEMVLTEYRPDGSVREHVVPHAHFSDLRGGARRRFTTKDLPFDLVLRDYQRNARPYLLAGRTPQAHAVQLEEIPPDPEKAEANMAGLTVEIVPHDGGARPQVLLWGFQRYPARLAVGGRPFDLDLRHGRWPLPFRIQLDDFQMEHHPGTNMASRYSSYVTKLEDGEESRLHITMNEPLRHRGFIVYQSGWGPPDASPGERLYSSFSVVHNHADLVPWISWSIILLGLLITFVGKLMRHLRAEGNRRLA